MNKWIAIPVVTILVIGVIVIINGCVAGEQTDELMDARAEIVALEENARSLEGDISTLESNISTLQGEVSTLEGSRHARIINRRSRRSRTQRILRANHLSPTRLHGWTDI